MCRCPPEVVEIPCSAGMACCMSQSATAPCPGNQPGSFDRERRRPPHRHFIGGHVEGLLRDVQALGARSGALMSIAGRTRPFAPRITGCTAAMGAPRTPAGGHAELPGGETGADVFHPPVEAHGVFGRGDEAVMGVEGRGLVVDGIDDDQVGGSSLAGGNRLAEGLRQAGARRDPRPGGGGGRRGGRAGPSRRGTPASPGPALRSCSPNGQSDGSRKQGWHERLKT